MKDYITIGSSPSGEDCAQVGATNYYPQVIKECRAFRRQLIRVFGPEPTNAKLVIKAFPHDFGTYHEVCVLYEDEDRIAADYALNIKWHTPDDWDTEAMKELGICT